MTDSPTSPATIGITENELQEAIRIAISRTQTLLTATMTELETRLMRRVDAIESRVTSVDTRTQEDIRRLDQKLDQKIEAMDGKLDVQASTLARIEGMLSQQQQTWDMMTQKQNETIKQVEQNQKDIMLTQSSQTSLMEDIHGSKDKPKKQSLWDMSSEMSAKMSDVLTMTAGNSSRIGDLEDSIVGIQTKVIGIEETVQYGQRLKSSVLQAKNMLAPILFSKSGASGIFIALGVALAIVLITSPQNAQPLIDLIERILGG